MKNIHIIPTDKPSRLVLNSINNDLFLTTTKKFPSNIMKFKNIYITDDSKIKEGDWVLFTSTNEVIKVPLGGFKGKVCKKIILTTYQDLIKDGVQAIDDEFLEWFVKNPNCEYVEIENIYDKFLNGDKRSVSDFRNKYKIIIPSEELMNDVNSQSWGFENFEVIKTEEDAKIFVETMENIPEPNDKLKKAFRDFNKQEKSKQGTLNHFLSTSNVIVKDSQKFDYKNTVLPKEFRQETLEEVAERLSNTTDEFNMFIAGAKWQQEKSYNELFEWLTTKDYLSDKVDVIQKEFKQFKKGIKYETRNN